MFFDNDNECSTEFSDLYFDPSRSDEFPLCEPPPHRLIQPEALAHDGAECMVIPGHTKERDASIVRAFLMWTLTPDEAPWWLDSTLCIDHREGWEFLGHCRWSVETKPEDIPF